MNSGLQELRGQLRQVLISLWRRRWLGVAAAWVVGLVSIPVVMLVPNRFVAEAQIYVDTQTVLKPLMQGLAFTPDVDQQVRMLARTLISRPNVEQLVARPDLGFGAAVTPAQRERMITELMKQIRVNSVSGNLYAINYRDTDADRALRLVEATLSLFVVAGEDSKRRDSQEAGRFIDEQIRLYEAKLVEAENRLKDFKLRNFGVSGISDQDFFVRMSALAEEVTKLRTDLSAAEQARDAFRRELAGESPSLPPEAITAAPPVPTETDLRLEVQRKQLDELLRRYTDAHPDVVSTRRVVEQLEARKRQEVADKAKVAAAEVGRPLAATSPVYQKIRISLADAEAQVASIRSQLAMKQARLDQLRATAGRIPQVEAELAQLNRDYDILSKNYRDLVSRRESASIGVRLDEQSKLAEFRIVEPPRVAPRPAFPSQLHAAAIALLAAIAAGLALPILLDYVFPTYRDAKKLRDATGREVLGTVSMALTPAVTQRLRSQGIGVAAACAGLLAIQAGWLIWLVGRLPGF